MEYVATTCPFCGCGCGLYLYSLENQLVGVAPSVTHPVSHGRLCERGWAAHEATLWGNRITTPLVRRNGRLEPATWDDALRAAEHGLRRLRDNGHVVGVLGSGRATDQENFMAATLARSGLRTGNVDTLPAQSWSALAAAMKSAPRDAANEVEHAELVLVIEGDLAHTHPRLASATLHAVRHGARLITIGWAPTRMSEIAHAHLRLPVRAPLRAFVELKGALAAAKLHDTDRAPDGEVAATANTIAQWLATSKRTVILFGVFDSDTQLIDATADALRTLSLYVKAAGGAVPVVVPLAPRANTRGAYEMGVTPDRLPGGKALDDAPTREVLQRLWGGNPSWQKGLTAPAFIEAAAGLVVLCDDLVAHSDTPARMTRTLDKLQCLVVIDAFMTPTASIAHVVFPTAAFGETDGTVTSLDGRRQRVQAYTSPPAGARAGWHILTQIAASLGTDFEPGHIGIVDDVIDRLIIRGAPDEIKPKLPLEDGGKADDNGRRPLRLRLEGAFDWSMDPLMAFSPTLRRSMASDRKLHPHGCVVVSEQDAATWKVREGGSLRLRSKNGAVETSVHVRAGQEPGVLFVPYAFRDELRPLMGEGSAVDVEVIRT